MATPGQSNYGGFVMTTTTEIVARNKAKGMDFCGLGDYLYIIRSDLGCYMKAHHDPHSNDPVKIYPLDPNCAWGDHYMATLASNLDENRFYIIRGDDCHVVTDLSTGAAPTNEGPQKFKLHEQCRGGDFYLAKKSNDFYVIKSSSNKYLHLNSLTHSILRNSEFNLPIACRECQYYWASSNHFHYLKPSGLEYYRTQDLGTTGEIFPICSPVTTFLRGGLVMTTPNQIVSHNQAKGTDICGQGNYLYIIRSDLGIFVRALHERDDNYPVTIHPLHPNCAWGDHYMATMAPNPDKKHFYIIRGDDCHVVTDLSTGAAPTTLNPPKFKLHEQCRGGDFYFARDSDSFFVIKSSKNKYLHSNGLTYRTLAGFESNLSVDCRECQYYWATDNNFYCLKCNPTSLECHRSKELNINSDGDTSTALYSSAATFLPIMPTGMATQIVPRNKAKGTDLCGQGSYQYIIRSDLGCYMKAYHVRDGDDPVTIHLLHPTCAWGDHYLATPDHFYIIKGNECRKVTDLSTGADPTTFTLNVECEDGDFYMAKNSKKFFVIKSNQGHSPFGCKHVQSLKDGNVICEKEMLDMYKEPNAVPGVDLASRYHWATSSYFYFLKPVTTWSLEYHRTKDLFKDPDKYNDYPVYPPIIAFLPGGLAHIMGPTFGRWEKLKSIGNNTANEKEIEVTIKRKHGYKKPMVHSVHHEWNVSQRERSASLTTEEIFKAALKRTFYFPPEYGGLAVDATNEDWSDVTEVEESLSVIIPSKQHVYVWQYVLGTGDQVVLHTKHIKKTKNDFEPQNVTADTDTDRPQNANEHRKRMLVPLPRTEFSEEQKCFVAMLQHESNKPSNFD